MKRLLAIIAVALMATAMPAVAQKTKDVHKAINRASELMKDARYEESRAILDSLLTINPNNADALYLRCMDHFEQDEFDDALNYCNEAIENYSRKSYYDDSILYYCRGNIKSLLNDFDSAIADFNKAFELTPKKDDQHRARILYNMSGCYYYKDNYEGVENNLLTALKYDEGEYITRIIYALSDLYLEMGEYHNAIACADELIEINVYLPYAYRHRIYAYLGLGDIHLAIDNAIKLTEVGTGNMEVDELTWILLHDKDYAVEALRKHIAEDTDYQYIDYHLAFAETIFDYETMLALFDNYSWDDPVEKLYRYAEYSAKAGKYDDAVKYISELLATQDDQDDIYYLTAKRCEYYRLAGEYDKAIVDAEQLVNIYSNEAYGYYTKGWLYELKGDDQKAMECYNEGIAHDDTYAYIYLMRGEQYLKRGETELAKADFERILELDTEVADGSCRHYALHFLGRDEEAIEWMEQIKDHMPYDCGVYYDEACLYARMGDVNRSLDALSQCLYYGYKSKAHIENDDDLDPIRHTEAYKRLMERYFNEQVSYVSAPYI